MGTKWDPTTKYIVGVGMFLAMLVGLYISRSMLGTIIFGAILAFLTLPVIRWLQVRLRFPRGVAAITTYLLLLVLVALIPALATPIAIDAVRDINVEAFIDLLQDQVDDLERWLVSIRTLHVFRFEFSLARVVDPLLESLAGTTPSEIVSLDQLLNVIPTALGSVTTIAGTLATTISSVTLTFFLALITAVYLSIDAPKFYRAIIELAPDAYREEFTTLIHKVANVWSAYFRGQITVSLILSLLTWLGTAAVGLPGAFLLGITAGVLALIPSLGPILSFIPAGIVALVQGSSYLPLNNFTFFFVVGALYVLIQQLEGNIITPRVVGQAIDLPPVVVLLGVLIGTSAVGLVGAVLASPTIATARVLGTYLWNKMLDRAPFERLEPRKIEPVQTQQILETVRTTRRELEERYQQLSLAIQGGMQNTHGEEEE